MAGVAGLALVMGAENARAACGTTATGDNQTITNVGNCALNDGGFTDVTLQNNGVISRTDNTVIMTGTDGQFINAGGAISAGGGDYSVSLGGSGTSVTNAGGATISGVGGGGAGAILVTGGSGNQVINGNDSQAFQDVSAMESPTDLDLFNLLLTNQSDATKGVIGDVDYASDAGGDQEVFNFGTMEAIKDTGDIQDGDATGDGWFVVVNGGTIGDDTDAIDITLDFEVTDPSYDDDEAIQIFNASTLDGAVTLDAARVELFNIGTDSGLADFFELITTDGPDQQEGAMAEEVRNLMMTGIADASDRSSVDGNVTQSGKDGTLVVNLGEIDGDITQIATADGFVHEYYATINSSVTGDITFNANGSTPKDPDISQSRIVNLGTIGTDNSNTVSSNVGGTLIVNGSDSDALGSEFFSDSGPTMDEVFALLRTGAAADNKGTINSDIDLTGAAKATILNVGIINGTIDFSGDNDTFLNVGTLDGNIDMGAGNDSVLMGTGTTLGAGVTIDGGANGATAVTVTLADGTSHDVTGDNLLFFGSATFDPTKYVNFENIIFDKDPTTGATNQIDIKGAVTIPVIVGAGQTIKDADGDDKLDIDNDFTIGKNAVVDVDLIESNGAGSDLTVQGAGTLDAAIDNFDKLVVAADSDGTWEINNDVTLATGIDVNSGLVSLGNNPAKTITAGTVDVKADSTLEGVAKIIGDIVVAGKDAPGNSIGTRNVEGNVTYNNGSSLEVEIRPVDDDGVADSDVLNVTGDVTFNDGSSLVVVAEDGTYAKTQSYDFLTYTGTYTDNVTGGLGSTLTTNLSYLTATLDDSVNGTLTLLVERQTTELGDDPEIEDKGFGDTLDKLSADASTPAKLLEAITNLSNQSGEKKKTAESSMSGKNTANISTAKTTGLSAFTGTVSGVQGQVRGGGKKLASISNSEYMSGMSAGNGTIFRPGYGNGVFWFKGFGGFGDVDVDNDNSDHDFGIYGASGGFTAIADTGYSLGVSVGYGFTEMDDYKLGDNAEIGSYHLAGSVGYTTPEEIEIDGMLGYSYNDYEQSRYVTDGVNDYMANSDFDGHEIIAQVAVAKTYDTYQGFSVRPFAGFTYSHEWREDYTESGAGALNLDVSDETYSKGIINGGVELASPVGENSIVALSAGAEHVIGDHKGGMSAKYVNTSTSFSVTGDDVARTSAVIGAGFNTEINESVNLGFDYSGKFNSDVKGHTMTGKVSVRW